MKGATSATGQGGCRRLMAQPVYPSSGTARWMALAAALGVTYEALIVWYCREMAWELDEDEETPLH